MTFTFFVVIYMFPSLSLHFLTENTHSDMYRCIFQIVSLSFHNKTMNVICTGILIGALTLSIKSCVSS